MKTTAKHIPKRSRPAERSHEPEWLQQWRQKRQPVVVKINNTTVYRVDDEGSIERLAHLLERLETITAIRKGSKTWITVGQFPWKNSNNELGPSMDDRIKLSLRAADDADETHDW